MDPGLLARRRAVECVGAIGSREGPVHEARPRTLSGGHETGASRTFRQSERAPLRAGELTLMRGVDLPLGRLNNYKGPSS